MNDSPIHNFEKIERRDSFFALLHSMRGIASLWVVLFHIYMLRGIEGVVASLPSWATYGVFGYGRSGVAIFFVVSGFVIAHSVMSSSARPLSLSRYMIRRSIRLDPPYWLSMIIVLALQWATYTAAGVSWPGVPMIDVLAHMAYLQEFLRFEPIQVVYWTLTYEIQFYLVLASVIKIFDVTEDSPFFLAVERTVWVVMTLCAFLAAFGDFKWMPHGLFLNYWHGFFLGVLTYNYYKTGRGFWICGLLALIMLATAPTGSEIFNAPAAVAGIFLLACIKFGQLNFTAGSHLLRALGNISYSLYLIHIPTITVAITLLHRIYGNEFVRSWPTLFVLIFACLSAAGIMWLFVEQPSHRLARHIFARKTS